ncbi:MAG: hypothetical protein EG823_01660 [Actinobacteria bacterium]|nr:hypothetical protein [Actinomycetota bacterium]
MRGTEDNLPSENPDERDDEGARFNRMRWALVGVLVVLFILLLSIVGFVSSLLIPASAPGTVKESEGLVWIRSIYGTSADAADQLQTPEHTAIAPDGTIWVTDAGTSRVLGFNPDGSFERELTVGADAGGAAMLDRPAGIAVSENGEVYVASSTTGLVLVWNADGEIDRVLRVPEPIQIALGGDRVLVTAADGLYLFNTQGEQVAKWSSRGSNENQVDMPNGALIGEDGTFYICDTHNSQLKAFSGSDMSPRWANPITSARGTRNETGAAPTPDQTVMREYVVSSSTEDTATAALAMQLQVPAGLTQDANGRLIFVDAFGFCIYAADPATGEINATYGGYGKADAQFYYPMGISYDPARDWFAVADTANHRVQIVRLDGSGGNAVTTLRGITFPWAVCCAPLILLLLALLVALMRRRRRRDEDAEREDEGESGELVFNPGVDSADSQW